jgi:hypothetical protein
MSADDVNASSANLVLLKKHSFVNCVQINSKFVIKFNESMPLNNAAFRICVVRKSAFNMHQARRGL